MGHPVRIEFTNNDLIELLANYNITQVIQSYQVWLSYDTKQEVRITQWKSNSKVVIYWA